MSSTDQSSTPTSSHAPLYGHKWQISVILKDGTTALDVSDSSFGGKALKVEFNIEQPIGPSMAEHAMIKIYNLNQQTERKAITSGDRVIISAGYEQAYYGKIYDGKVFQPMRDRVDNVNYILGLHCLSDEFFTLNKPVNYSIGPGHDMRGRIDALCKATGLKKGYITPDIENDKTKFPRGRVYYGSSRTILRNIGRGYAGAIPRVEGGKINIIKFSDISKTTALVITPSTGLIGTPQETEIGISFTTLLDPRLWATNKYPYLQVKLDQTLVRQLKRDQGSPVSQLDKDGIYNIASVTYEGDTRGNPWYCHCIGIAQHGLWSNLKDGF